jgi:hypothetical protein
MAATRDQIIEAVTNSSFSHARQGTGCWRDVVWIYHFDAESPSCFKLALGADASEVNPIIHEYRRPATLSPAEKR